MPAIYDSSAKVRVQASVNIFVLDRSPERAARYHCERHVVKMVLETAQIPGTAVWLKDAELAGRLSGAGRIYKHTHKSHPCTLWATESRCNFHWLAAANPVR